MAKLQAFRRLITEDVEQKDRALMGKLAYAINPFADDVLNALNKNLTIEDNINWTKQSIQVAVDSSGKPLASVSFKTSLNKVAYGLSVEKATNLTTPTNYPTGYPFISYSESNGVITVNNITGLPANQQFKLDIIIKG